MSCQVKSVSQYIEKYKNKLNSLAKTNNNQIQYLITDLKEIDKTLPPNQSPFGIFSKKSSDSFKLILSLDILDKSSTQAPNVCPFEPTDSKENPV